MTAYTGSSSSPMVIGVDYAAGESFSVLHGPYWTITFPPGSQGIKFVDPRDLPVDDDPNGRY